MRKTDLSVRLSGPVIPTSNYTVNETRVITGKSRSAIYDAIHKGLLDARKDGARTCITGRSILDYQANLPRI